MLNEEQRERLEQAGWISQGGVIDNIIYAKDDTSVSTRAGKQRLLYSVDGIQLSEVLEFAAILGIQPRGYRLVPDEVAQEWVDALYATAYADAHPESEDALEAHESLSLAEVALASALSPKEEDKPHE